MARVLLVVAAAVLALAVPAAAIGQAVCLGSQEIPGGHNIYVQALPADAAPGAFAPAECSPNCALQTIALASPSGALWGTNAPNSTKLFFSPSHLAASSSWDTVDILSGHAPVQAVAAAGTTMVVLHSDGTLSCRTGISASALMGAGWTALPSPATAGTQRFTAMALVPSASPAFLVLQTAGGALWAASISNASAIGSWSEVVLDGPALSCTALAARADGNLLCAQAANGTLFRLSMSSGKGAAAAADFTLRWVPLAAASGSPLVAVAALGTAVWVADTRGGLAMSPNPPTVAFAPVADAPACSVLSAASGWAPPPPALRVVPKPQSVTFDREQRSLTFVPANFAFRVVGAPSSILTNAITRYRALAFPPSPAPPPPPPSRQLRAPAAQSAPCASLDIDVTSADTTLSLQTNESYRLTLSADNNSAVLRAPTVYGALRGLETFAQLLAPSAGGGNFSAPAVDVIDFPRFAYRGLMVDPARRYLPMNALYAVVDAMSYDKLNVLHMHLTDDQSFPLVLSSHPELAAAGAFAPGLVYTPAALRKLVAYARDRGIRVIAELDTPGHSGSWTWSRPAETLACGLLNPTLDATYTLLREVLAELKTIFTDAFYFAGGDEVSPACWSSSPQVQQWLTAHNMSVDALQAYYEQKLLAIVRGQGQQAVVWQEAFQMAADPIASLGNDTLVDVWKGQDFATLDKVTAAGMRAVFSGPWYLDMINSDTAWGREWISMYQVDPQFGFNGTAAQRALVVGGHGCIWGEAADETNLFARVWPRLSAVAERLWSDRNATQDIGDAGRRLHFHRCMQRQRGIPASPVGLFSKAFPQTRESFQTFGWCESDHDYAYTPPWEMS